MKRCVVAIVLVAMVGCSKKSSDKPTGGTAAPSNAPEAVKADPQPAPQPAVAPEVKPVQPAAKTKEELIAESTPKAKAALSRHLDNWIAGDAEPRSIEHEDSRPVGLRTRRLLSYEIKLLRSVGKPGHEHLGYRAIVNLEFEGADGASGKHQSTYLVTWDDVKKDFRSTGIN